VDVFSEIRTNIHFDITTISNPKIISKENHSVLQEAIAWNHDLALKMINLGININHQDNEGATALQYALSRGYYDVSRKILCKNPMLNLVDKHGNNALWTAVLNPRKDYTVINDLIKRGASIYNKNRAGQCVLNFVILSNNQKIIDLINNYK